jgi:hypothetical protein
MTKGTKPRSTPDRSFNPASDVQSRKGAMEYLGVGRSTLGEMIKQEILETVPFGRTVKIKTPSLVAVAQNGFKLKAKKRRAA